MCCGFLLLIIFGDVMALEHISIPIFLLGGIIFITFCFVELLLWHNEKECECEFKTTLESYHKKCVLTVERSLKMKYQILEQLKSHGGGLVFSDLAKNFVENNILISNELRRLTNQCLIEKIENEYFITDTGVLELNQKKPPDELKISPKTVDEIMLQPSKKEIIKIATLPINEKTVDEIKHHVNGSTPDYYKGKTIQVFDILEEFLTPEANQGFMSAISLNTLCVFVVKTANKIC